MLLQRINASTDDAIISMCLTIHRCRRLFQANPLSLLITPMLREPPIFSTLVLSYGAVTVVVVGATDVASATVA